MIGLPFKIPFRSFILTSSVFEKGNVRSCNTISLFVGTRIYPIVPPNTNTRIRRSQINADARTFHDCAAATILVGVAMWKHVATFRHTYLCYEVVQSRARAFGAAVYMVASWYVVLLPVVPFFTTVDCRLETVKSGTSRITAFPVVS
jgi:hypothetical protein